MNKKLLVSIVLILFLSIPVSQTIAGYNASATIQYIIEDILFETEYSINTNLPVWRITDNKAIDIKLSVLDDPKNATILIEHLHIDCFIESTKKYFDGVLQDSMDDHIHEGNQAGFFVNENYSYYETFSIEGFNPEFVEQIIIACQMYYGYAVHNSERPVTISEEKLINDYGVYGTSFIFVYDVLIKYPSEEYFHKRIITDNIFVYLNGTVMNNPNNRIDEEAQPKEAGYSWLYSFSIFPILALLVFVKKRK